jgi:hypothetical protein
MCFSATASFTTAAITGLASSIALPRAIEPREKPLAAIPLLFAAQQTIEGLLWLTLPVAPQSATCTTLTHSFLFFALLLWPVYGPLSAYLIEDVPWRKRAIAACMTIGAGVSLYLLSVLLGGTHTAIIKSGHIIYDTEPPPNGAVGIFYLIATGLGLALSSHKAINLLAIIVVIGSVVAYVAYWGAFVSVWCFFAAAASAVIVAHFEQARRSRRMAARS